MMKLSLIIGAVLVFISCTHTKGHMQQQEKLSALEFADKIAQTEDAVVVDVRTPGEFAKGHLEHALNIDWNSDDFDAHIALLDKSAPVFVYCLSGGRSSSAAAKMRNQGFKHVFEMPGGMMEWRAKKLPEIAPKTAVSGGIRMEDYQALIQSDKLVLVDFYADWCVPCKKMEPYLDRIADELADRVTVVRVDADAHWQLCEALGVSGLPVLKLYDNKSLVWEHQGYIDEAGIRKQLH